MSTSYCLNIHPGESLDAVRHAITHYATAVKAQLSPNTPYPLGLRLAASAAAELDQSSAALSAFADLLHEHGFYATEINGFPYGTFHGSRVKSDVYQPDWSTTARCNYTLQLARILAKLLNAGQSGSISTVPLGYKQLQPSGLPGNHTAPPLHASPLALASAHHLARVAMELAKLEQESGRHIAVALEPEPDCLLESSDEVITWFENTLPRTGLDESILRRYLTICLDTCHFAVNFEEPLTALKKLEHANITISRIQLSAALKTTITPGSLRSLRPFVDPIYLHQTRIQLTDGTLISMPDLLEEQLTLAGNYHSRELRTHFHIPLYFEGSELLQSTRDTLSPEFMQHVRQQGYPLEVETYTFDVLPPHMRSPSVTDNIIRECLTTAPLSSSPPAAAPDTPPPSGAHHPDH